MYGTTVQSVSFTLINLPAQVYRIKLTPPSCSALATRCVSPPNPVQECGLSKTSTTFRKEVDMTAKKLSKQQVTTGAPRTTVFSISYFTRSRVWPQVATCVRAVIIQCLFSTHGLAAPAVGARLVKKTAHDARMKIRFSTLTRVKTPKAFRKRRPGHYRIK